MIDNHEPGQIEPDLMTAFDWSLILAATGLAAFVAGSFATIIFNALRV